MAGFSLVASDCLDHSGDTSKDTASLTPAVGDICFIGVRGNTGTGTLSGGGMTWTERADMDNYDGDASNIWAFEATAGTPSAGVLTFTIGSGTITDMTYAVVRPSGLNGAPNWNGGNANTGNSLTITMDAGTYEALLGYGHTQDPSNTFATYDIWTELLDDQDGNGSSHNIQYLIGDDDELVIDPSGTSQEITGIVLSFTLAAHIPTIYVAQVA